MLHIYLAARHYYGHVAAIHILILMNCYGITNLLLQNLLSLKIRPFYKIFILRKFGAIWYVLKAMHTYSNSTGNC